MITTATARLGPLEPLGLGGIGLIAALAYMVIAGGTDSGAVQPALIAITSIIGGASVMAVIVSIRRGVDRIDLGVLLAVAVFSLSAIFSDFPRQSVDVVLAALSYSCGLVLARRILRRPSARRLFAMTMIGLSLVFTVGIAAVWGSSVADWMAAAAWALVPPLNLELASSPWGHRYDLALLLLLLYPAWWIERPGRLRRVLAVIVGIAIVGLVVLSGSRTLWLAPTISVAVLAVPLAWRLVRDRRIAWVGAGMVLLVLATAWASGVLGPVVSRASNFESASYRLAMWEPLIDLWRSETLAGLGPGSFPWLLQLTPYFETNTYAPRHPDNALVQLVVEAGLIGVIAAAIALVVLVPSVLRGRSTTARWVAILFLAACVGMNPTDFAFLLVPMIGWVAYAAPSRQSVGEAVTLARRTPSPRLVWLAGGGLVVLGVAHAGTVAAAFAHQAARQAAASGHLDVATRHFDTAVTLDPGMALYWRERGVARYLGGELAGATDDLHRSAAINPADDVTWRALALVEDDRSDPGGAAEAIGKALRLERSDPSNLLVAAILKDRDGNGEAATALLTELVKQMPFIVGAEAWDSVAGGRSEAILQEALDRWTDSDDGSQRNLGQPFYLMALLEPEAYGTASSTGILGQAAAASLRCDVTAAELINEVPASERGSPFYLETRIRTAAIRGEVDESALRAFQVQVGWQDAWLATDATVNAFNDTRWWGYRRLPTFWPAGLTLPSPRSGEMRWMQDPSAAVHEAGIEHLLPECR